MKAYKTTSRLDRTGTRVETGISKKGDRRGLAIDRNTGTETGVRMKAGVKWLATER